MASASKTRAARAGKSSSKDCVAGGADYAGKPRPVVVLQNEVFADIESVTVCPITSDPVDLPLFRVKVEPTPTNGLRVLCSVMADKVTTVRREKLGRAVGRLSDGDLLRVSRVVLVFLGLAG